MQMIILLVRTWVRNFFPSQPDSLQHTFIMPVIVCKKMDMEKKIQTGNMYSLL